MADAAPASRGGFKQGFGGSGGGDRPGGRGRGRGRGRGKKSSLIFPQFSLYHDETILNSFAVSTEVSSSDDLKTAY